MRRAVTIQGEVTQIETIENLTGVFESIASLKISKVRHRVVASKEFFAELWQTYSQLRVDHSERIGQRKATENGKQAFVIVTSEGKLSGEIDDEIIREFSKAYTQPDVTDVIAIGSHGQAKLKEQGIKPAYAFALPKGDDQFSVGNIVEKMVNYERTVVFYQTYESLRTQKVASIELNSAIRTLSGEVDEAEEETVSTKNFIFEPSINEIADYLESLMIGVALTQVIMESKLAQHASRFNAMNSAKRRAHDLTTDLKRQYYRSKRNEGDERLKEIMKVIINGGLS